MIYVREKAYNTLKRNLENRSEAVLGYFKESNVWVAFDNSSLEMFVEEFKYEKDAIAWVNGFDSIFDENIKTKWLFRNIVYVSGGNFIKIKIKDETMHSIILKIKFINSIKYYWVKITRVLDDINLDLTTFIRRILKFI
jgi:hypothetical protein